MAPRNKNMVAEKEQRKANHMKKVLLGNETTKTMSFKKRFPTLKKKAQELKTLCNVSVCIVCFGRDGTLHTFPDNKIEMKDLVEGFKRLNENAKKEMSLIEFLEEQAGKNKSKKFDEKFLRLSKWLEELSEADALEFLDSKFKSFKEKLEILDSKEHKTRKENWVADFNNYGRDIVGSSGLQENNSSASIDDNNKNLPLNFRNQQESFPFLPEPSNFIIPNYYNGNSQFLPEPDDSIVSNCHNLPLTQLESDLFGGFLGGRQANYGGYLHEVVSLWEPAQV